MIRNSTLFAAIGVSLLALGETACTGTSQAVNAASSPQADARIWGRATISGQKSDLKNFDEKLKQILGFSVLEEHEIGCIIGCDKFASPDPLDKTVYVFPRDKGSYLSKFSAAWDSVHRAGLDPDFALELSPVADTGNCDPVLDPPPCQNMPFCATDQCGAKISGKIKCDAC